MSAGISNLGMGLSGFAPTRYDSGVVGTDADYAAQQAAALSPFQQVLANIQAPQSVSQFAQPFVNQAAADLYNSYKAAGLDIDPATVLANQQYLYANQQGGFSNPVDQAATVGGAGNVAQINAYAQGLPLLQQNYQQQSQQAQQALQAQQAAQQQAALTRQNRQAATQQAYNQQTGGGFTGGILNSSYANPFGNTVTGFSGGLMGGGGSAAPSTGLTPTGPAASSAATNGFGSTGGWGGPFGASNPWALS